jgi:anaerobic selenocysteine-containing dehydrogenase
MLNRRNFLKLGGTAATVTVAGNAVLSQAAELPHRGGMDFSPATGESRTAVPSACWQCVTRCANIVYVEDDRVVKIEGQPASIRTEGKMCAKGQGGVNQANDPDRILHPMRRVGQRGEGKWKRVTWDEALGEVSERLQALRDAGTPEKLAFHYGRMKGSSSKLIKSVFLANYGTGTIGNHTSICEGGKWTAQELTWGKHYDSWDFDNTNYVLNFGSNVLEAHTNHAPSAQRLVRALTERNVNMVTFDVRLSNTAAKSTEWVPVKPGSDLAVVLAMCNVVMSEDLYNGLGTEFLEFVKVTPDPKATTAEKIATLKAHLEQYTPEWAEAISGVEADKIRRIAREFATNHPAVVMSYRGAVAHHNGNDTERAVQMLAAITGNVDNPGGRCKGVGASWKYPKGPKNKPKSKKLKIADGPKGSAAIPSHHMSHNILKMIKDGTAGRPDVYMWYCYTPVYANGEVQENIDILKDENLIPFSVCSNPFYDESAALADLILPDTTYLERWDWEDMVSPNQVPEYYIRQPAISPMGEVRNFADVCCDLAKRMGFPLGFDTMQEFVQQSCDKTAEVKAVGGLDYMRGHGVYHNPDTKPKYYSYRKALEPEVYAAKDVILDAETGVYWNWKKGHHTSEADAIAKGYTHTKKAYEGYVGQLINGKAYSGFKPDKVNKSGYFELYFTLMEEKGFPPLPTWTPVPEHQQMGVKDMVLTTFKFATQIHSRSQNCKWLTEIYHDNPAWINPVDAQVRNIQEGDVIKVTSPVGEIVSKAKVTPAVMPGVIAISHHCGHWEYGSYASSRPAPDGRTDDPDLQRKWWQANGVHPNWIIPNAPDPVNGQMRWMDTVVQVTKA